jgi:hypothetical protein
MDTEFLFEEMKIVMLVPQNGVLKMPQNCAFKNSEEIQKMLLWFAAYFRLKALRKQEVQ